MANCTGVQSSQGTGQAATGFGAAKLALGHFMLNGQVQCTQKTCNSGTCTFGITAAQFQALEWTGPTQVGNEVRVSVSGDGVCFCQ